ncbi:hypothetical protein BCR39DRAFT_556219 [Naematelia encephala]|uniref:Uncharacterized protein n=1 Tax=Naematelia encephala TaxID=71784 RepID=A0A1Y2BJD9_9TREE|nr:hypothetical protein BCR39DRAFT_556219 [Naematelia encephala]
MDMDDVVSLGGDDDAQDNENVPDIPVEGTPKASIQEATPVLHEEIMAEGPGPSDSELQLAKRVVQLERDNERLLAENAALHSRFPAHTTTIPVSSPNTTPHAPLVIPHELLPTLSLLRKHIAELTRDNEALRYTFLGTRSATSTVTPPTASSSKITLDLPSTPASSTLAATSNVDLVDASGSSSASGMKTGHEVDVGAVLGRVKELVKENEELGEMVLEAGRATTAPWEKALEESRAVISSLDSDLTHHLSVIQALRTEVGSLKSKPIPLGPKTSQAPVPREATATSTLSAKSQPRHDDRRHRGNSNNNSNNEHRGDRDRDRDRERSREPAPATMIRKVEGVGGGGVGSSGAELKIKGRGGVNSVERATSARSDSGGAGGSLPNGHRQTGRREEDREPKRRR